MTGFQKATKKQAKARILIEAVSGGGKTWTGIQTAGVLAKGGRIAVIDSEEGSASLYGDLFDFDVLEISAPYTPARYIEAIKLAEKEGYAVVMIDSLTHAWAGSGGVLQMVDDAMVRFGNNKQRAWAVGTPAWQSLIDAMLQTRMHVIATLRSKSKMVEDTNAQGKVTGYKKAGTEPVARDGIEFEFTISAELDREHNMVIGKSRCPILPPGTVLREPKGDLAEAIIEWLDSGEEYVAPVDTDSLARELIEQSGDKAALVAAMKGAGISSSDLADPDNFARARVLVDLIVKDREAALNRALNKAVATSVPNDTDNLALIPEDDAPVVLDGEAA